MKNDRITFLVEKKVKKQAQRKCITQEVALSAILTMLLMDWINGGK